MKFISSAFLCLSVCLISPQLFAKEGGGGGSSGGGAGVGFNFGFGAPFLTQAGLSLKLSNYFAVHGNYNLFNIDVGDAGVKLSMPEVILHYHPFGGAFFLGAGMGQEKLDVSAVDSTTSTKVKVEVEASTTIAKIGWMWGSQNNGFWFGIDFSYITPTDAKQTITAPGVPTTSDAYIDSVDAADKFGETSYGNITFARFGWIF